MHGAEVYPSVSGMGLGRYNPVLIHSPAAYHCACIVYIQIRRKMACLGRWHTIYHRGPHYLGIILICGLLV